MPKAKALSEVLPAIPGDELGRLLYLGNPDKGLPGLITVAHQLAGINRELIVRTSANTLAEAVPEDSVIFAGPWSWLIDDTELPGRLMLLSRPIGEKEFTPEELGPVQIGDAVDKAPILLS